MKISHFGCAIFTVLLTALLWGVTSGQEEAVSQPEGFWANTTGVITACGSFPPGEVDISAGALTFLKPITCESPKVLFIKDNVILRSHTAISAKNVHFVVDEGSSLTITTRGSITFERDEDSTLPLFQVRGQLRFEAGDWMEDHLNGSAEDHSDILSLSGSGKIRTLDTVHYTSSSIMVADMSAADKAMSEDDPAVKLTDPALQASLREFHAASNARNDPTEPRPAPTKINNNNVRGSTQRGSAGQGSADDEGTAGHGGSSSSNNNNNNNDNDNNRGTRGDGRSKWGDRSHSYRSTGEKKDRSGGSGPLRVGEVRVGPVSSDDGAAAVWTGNEGSIIHFKFSEAAAPSGADTGPSVNPADVHQLVPPSPRRLKDMIRTRALVEDAARSGVDAAGLKEARGGFWSLGARRRQKKMQRAADNLYEIALSIDNRGSITVTVDGTPVLSKSGPHKREWRNKFPWRRAKNQRYELHATGDGFEVQLRGKTVWSLSAADIF